MILASYQIAAFSAAVEHGIHDATNNIHYLQFGMVPDDSNDLLGIPLLSSDSSNCAIDPALFDASTLNIDYCMSQNVDVDWNDDRGIIGVRFKGGPAEDLLGIGAQSNCSPPVDGTATTTLTNPLNLTFRLQVIDTTLNTQHNDPSYKTVTNLG